MAEYRLLTIWRIEAPLEAVYATIHNALHGPDGWPGMRKVEKVAADIALGLAVTQSQVATAHTENCANRFRPMPVAPFSRYRAQAQSGSNRLVVDDQ